MHKIECSDVVVKGDTLVWENIEIGHFYHPQQRNDSEGSSIYQQMKLEDTEYTVYYVFDDPCWHFGTNEFFDACPLVNLEAVFFKT